MDNQPLDLNQSSEILVAKAIGAVSSVIKGTEVETQPKISDIDVYKEVLSNRFMEVETLEDYEKILALRQRLQKLDVETKRLTYAQKSSEIQLQQAQQKVILQNGQQIGAIVASVIIGAVILPTVPLGGLLFLILGLAKPLGYSLGEIGVFLDSLKSLPKDADKILAKENEQIDQIEESKDARF